jgi:hypothetical protein
VTETSESLETTGLAGRNGSVTVEGYPYEVRLVNRCSNPRCISDTDGAEVSFGTDSWDDTTAGELDLGAWWYS